MARNLKIERVEVFGVAMPLTGTFTSAGVSKQATKCVVVRLTASDGTIGISSIEPSATAKSPDTAADLAVTIRERIAPAIVGQDPTNINRLIELLDGLTPTQPGAGAAVEMACVELASRIAGRAALHVARRRAAGRTSNSTAGSASCRPRRRRRKRSAGSRPGSAPRRSRSAAASKRITSRIAAVREAVGSAMKLRIDANMQYDADTSLRLCRMVRQYDLQLFEQPVPQKDLAGMARVRREGGIPVMADESVSDHASLLAVIKADAADFVKFGIKQAGGILRSARMLATAEAAGLPVVIGHGFGLDPSTLAEIMLAASSRNVLPGLECVGPLKVVDTVATTRLDISSGSLPLPGGPGIGISLDDRKLEQYRLN